MEEINIRNGSWYWVNTAVNACPHISPTDKTVYAALCTFGGCAEIRPTFALISQRSALSVRSCKYSIIKLLEVGYISIENHGKKGVANVYNLLKAVNGCKKCKPCTTKEVQEMSEEVQDRAGSSANLAPQIDKELNKELNKESLNQSNANVAKDEIAETIYLFKDVNPSYKKLFGNTTQRGAVSRLIKEHGDDKERPF